MRAMSESNHLNSFIRVFVIHKRLEFNSKSLLPEIKAFTMNNDNNDD